MALHFGRGARKSKLASYAGTVAKAQSNIRKFKSVYEIERRNYETGKTGIASTFRLPKPVSVDDFSENPEAGKKSKVTTEERWLAMYQELLQKGIRPVQYVRGIFFGLKGTTQSPPAPSRLLDSQWLDFYYKVQSRWNQSIEMRFKLETDLALQKISAVQGMYGVSTLEAIRSVVLMTDSGLSPLYRYCLARNVRKKSMTRLAEKLQHAAAAQYMSNRGAYDRSDWGKWLPADFVECAAELYFD